MRRLRLRADARDAGERLDRFIAARGGISRGLARRLLDTGGVFLDGRRCKVASRSVREGQEVVVNVEEGGRAASSEARSLEPARLLYVDDHLVAVDKPALVPAQPTLTSDEETLPALVQGLLGSPVTIVHRLDRPTSGVTLLARTAAAAAALSEAFRLGLPEKLYLALTARAPSPASGAVDAPLGPHPHAPGRRAVMPSGDPARTRYETLRERAGGALVACRPETGRTHQIRVHLAHLGAPLLGDVRYGGPSRASGEDIPRVMLHARRISFRHPVTGTPMTMQAPLPRDFLQILERLVPPMGGEPDPP